MRDDRGRLLDILEAIENINRRAAADRDDFIGDEMLHVWVIHHIQIIGEAASNLSPQLRDRYPAVPWADIISMRNILVHQYFGVDPVQVWDTVAEDLPKLGKEIETVLRELEEKT